MKYRLTTWLRISLLSVAAATAAYGQGTAMTTADTQVPLSSVERGPADGQILREIDDPSLGTRWLLMHNSAHWGGPGRLVPAAMVRSEGRREVPALVSMRPVIRAGDRLVVTENTAVIDARFEAIALGPAMVGSPLNVRLKIGGMVLRAVAMGPGQAVIQPGNGAGR